MGNPVKYLVPYQATYSANDVKSGKKSDNVLYFRTRIATSSPPAYGATLAGSDIDVLAANVMINWRQKILPIMSVNYKMNDLTLKEVTGWTVGGPPKTVNAASNTSPIAIRTLFAHNFTSGDLVVVAGVLGNTAANGTWTISVVDPFEFTLTGSTGNAPYSGGGTVSLVVTEPRLTFGDSSIVPALVTDVGGTAGEALPMHASMSIRKISTTAGRNFRGGVRTSPHAETDQIDGKWTAARLPVFITAWFDYIDQAIANRTTGVLPQDFEDHIVLSFNLALAAASPFTQSDSFVSRLTNYVPRPNLGSMVRRKPKLTAPIA